MNTNNIDTRRDIEKLSNNKDRDFYPIKITFENQNSNSIQIIFKDFWSLDMNDNVKELVKS